MSYDLMVFEPSAAPHDRKAFLHWYDEQTEWTEDHGYNSSQVCSPALQAWYADMVQLFPDMQTLTEEELDAEEENGQSRSTDYSLGRAVIYAAFAWSQAEEAYTAVKHLAERHGVGFFDASGAESPIFWPTEQSEGV